MKLTELIRLNELKINLKEIGERSIKPDKLTSNFAWNGALYTFEYEGIKFTVPISFIRSELIISFSVDNSYTKIVNKGALQIMARILYCVEDYLESDELKERTKYLHSIEFEPSKNTPNDDRREKLYLMYFKKWAKRVGVDFNVTNDNDSIKIQFQNPLELDNL